MGTRPVGQIYWTQKFFSLIIQSFGMDMSFPAATIILSNSLPKAQQGIAASLVATFQNYCNFHWFRNRWNRRMLPNKEPSRFIRDGYSWF